MLWILLTLAAGALLAWLIAAMRRYERESAGAALAETQQLRDEVAALTRRVQNLEAIVSVEEESRLPYEAGQKSAAARSAGGRRPPLHPGPDVP